MRGRARPLSRCRSVAWCEHWGQGCDLQHGQDSLDAGDCRLSHAIDFSRGVSFAEAWGALKREVKARGLD
jgi:hypothetical protein